MIQKSIWFLPQRFMTAVVSIFSKCCYGINNLLSQPGSRNINPVQFSLVCSLPFDGVKV